MAVTVEEMKNYLRLDHDEDDGLIETLISAAVKQCVSVARSDSEDEYWKEGGELSRQAVIFAAAYMYEHREEASHKELVNNSLRFILHSLREAKGMF